MFSLIRDSALNYTILSIIMHFRPAFAIFRQLSIQAGADRFEIQSNHYFESLDIKFRRKNLLCFLPT